MLCYSGWRTHKGICSWTGPLSGDGILFLKLSVPLKRRRWKARSEPGWVCRCHTCGAGSLAPWPASPLGWKLADPRAAILQRCSKGVCIHGERFPVPWMWPFVRLFFSKKHLQTPAVNGHRYFSLQQQGFPFLLCYSYLARHDSFAIPVNKTHYSTVQFGTTLNDGSPADGLVMYYNRC